MSKNYRIDLTTAKPAALAGYFDSALFAEWITGLDDSFIHTRHYLQTSH